MDDDADHYAILGLPSGIAGARLSEKEISKAYRLKALELHPDKRPDDPDAPIKFKELKISYEVLKDKRKRKEFDDQVQVKHDKLQRESQQDSKRRKMISDLEKREQAAMEAREEEKIIARKLKEEIARFQSGAARSAFHDVSNSLPVRPFQPAQSTSSPIFPSASRNAESFVPKRSNLDSAGFQAFEDSVLEKLRKKSRAENMSINEPSSVLS